MFRLRVAVDHPLVQLRSAIHLVVTDLHLDVSRPRLLIRLPRHPPLKDLTSSGNIAEKLFKEDVFVPDLVDAGEEGDGAVEEVTSVGDVTSFELLQKATTVNSIRGEQREGETDHFRVSEPKLDASGLDIESTLEDGSRTVEGEERVRERNEKRREGRNEPRELVLTRFPVGIFSPGGDLQSRIAISVRQEEQSERKSVRSASSSE
jgi:hypothetical protein